MELNRMDCKEALIGRLNEIGYLVWKVANSPTDRLVGSIMEEILTQKPALDAGFFFYKFFFVWMIK
jgi:hypothetical protein